MENNERVYTEATPRLKALHKAYGGSKSGDADKAKYFDNCDLEHSSGNFYANTGDGGNNISDAYNGTGYKHVTEKEFIDFMDLVELDKQVNGTNDAVNKPSHYTAGAIEPIDYIAANNMNFCEGNVIKYVTRYKLKNGLEDLKKAQFYINKLIEGYDQN